LFQTFSRGDGQTAGQRVGVFGYYGWQPTTRVGNYVGSNGATDGKNNVGFYRVGGDVSLNWRTFNLMGLIMSGRDDKKLNEDDPNTDYEFTGGFLRLDWAGLPNNRLVASGMFNWVNYPETAAEPGLIRTGSGLVRYYLGDWTAVNIALHAEYTYHEIVGGEHDHTAAMFIDFDF